VPFLTRGPVSKFYTLRTGRDVFSGDKCNGARSCRLSNPTLTLSVQLAPGGSLLYLLPVNDGMGFRFLARRKIRIRITVCHGRLILLVAFRPRDHVREIERPHDLEPIEHGEGIAL
jgi:hypothetical protein